MIFVVVSFIFMGCSGTREVASVEEETVKCSEMGVFRSFQNNTGCHLLLVLHDGRKLLVVEGVNQGPRPSDGMEVRVDYEEVADMVSVCEVEHAVVRITCMEVLVFPETECANKVTVFKRNWMQDAISSFNPKEIKVLEQDTINYFLLSGENTIIFNCYGKIDCFIQGARATKFCEELRDQFAEGEVIWTQNY